MTSTVPDLAALMAEFWPKKLAWLPAPSGEDVLCSATGLVMSGAGYLLLPFGLAGGDAYHTLGGKRVRVSATCGLHGVDLVPDAAWVERARTFVGAYNGRVQAGDDVPVAEVTEEKPDAGDARDQELMQDMEELEGAREEARRCEGCPFAVPIYRTVAVPMPVPVPVLPDPTPQPAPKTKPAPRPKPAPKSVSTTPRRGKMKAATGKDYLRKCHDCGAPTTNFRCDACRAKAQGRDRDVSPLDPELGDVTYHGTV